jgi:hypothetical protein
MVMMVMMVMMMMMMVVTNEGLRGSVLKMAASELSSSYVLRG